MRIRSFVALILLIGAAVLAARWHSPSAAPTAAPTPDSAAVADSMRIEAAERDRAIAFFERRLEEDPASALDLAHLASRYLQRARETGSSEDLAQAESAARRSLALRTSHNAATYVTLASALLSQHRFREAETAARAAVAYDPAEPAYWSLLGDVALERGDYPVAKAAFDSVRRGPRTLPSMARLARWAELRGRTTDARTIWRRALREAQARRDLPREQRAWFHLQAGEYELRQGEVTAADSLLRAGVAVAPLDHRLHSALARLALAQGRSRAAIAHGDQALALQLDPSTLAVMSDAHAALGEQARADEFAEALRVVVVGQPGPLHHDWGLFLLDRGRDVPLVLRRAREALRERQDVHTLDLLAWALHQSGQHEEAHATMQRALSLGTTNAVLLYHAGMIALARGDSAQARTLLERARAANRYYAPAARALAGWQQGAPRLARED